MKDAKGRPLSQTDTPARPSAEHSAHAVGHAHCKATRIKASVDGVGGRDLQGYSGYRSFSDPGNYSPISLLSVPPSSSSRLAVRRQLLELASGAANVRSLKKTC